MESKLSRKEAIRAYKERKIPRGIFAVRCPAIGQVWVDSTPNLGAAQNSLWFALRLGSHTNKSLQAAWNTRNGEGFVYEILETLDDGVSPMALSDLLKEKKAHWVARLGAQRMV